MFDRTQAVRRYAQLDALAERIGNQRDVLQVRKERALRLIVGVGNIVSHLPALAGQLANPRHDQILIFGRAFMPRPEERRPLAAWARRVNVTDVVQRASNSITTIAF